MKWRKCISSNTKLCIITKWELSNREKMCQFIEIELDFSEAEFCLHRRADCRVKISYCSIEYACTIVKEWKLNN